jgi:hypothetical protein
MGVSTLVGEADGTTHAAAMYCNTSGWMVGPIWEAPDAEDQVEAFLAWMGSGRWRSAVESLAIRATPYLDSNDVRQWDDGDLGKLISYWRHNYVGEDGWLLDPYACTCDHHHMGEDGEHVRAGACEQFASSPDTTTNLPCPCTAWTPGNRAAELAAKED